jgi:hypothetical protein
MGETDLHRDWMVYILDQQFRCRHSTNMNSFVFSRTWARSVQARRESGELP